jgi:DNA polymerase-3 subunit delta'
MKLPKTLQGISSAFAAAQTLVDLATQQAPQAAELRNEKETDDLSLAYGKGATGRGMATCGNDAEGKSDRAKLEKAFLSLS